MSDMDDKLRSTYSRLPREEPPAALDAAILDASRRAVAPRRSMQRWAVPMSVAAVLVLAFGIAIHRDEYPTSVEESRMAAPQSPPIAEAPPVAQAPPIVQALPQPPAPATKPEAAPVPRPKKAASAAVLRDERAQEGARANAEAKPERKDLAFAPEPQRAAAAQATLQKETANAAPEASAPMQAPAPAAPPASAAAPAPREADALRAQPRMKMEAARQAPAVAGAQPPDEITRELDAVAKLRAEGRNEEADKALEAFRRKHPDYRIPDAVWERVKPR